MILEFQTLPELLTKRVKISPDKPAFSQLNDENKWISISWKEFNQKVELTSARLWSQGIRPSDRVGIMLSNCLDWEILHHAVLRLGAVVVGFEKVDPPERLAEIFDNSQPAAFFIENVEQANFLNETQLLSLRITVTFSPIHSEGWETWDKFNQLASNPQNLPPLPNPQQPATLIYTSGTTGSAKGILYTQAQLAMATQSIIRLYGKFLKEDSKFISWLPLTALSQRIANLSGIILAAEVYFLADPRRIMEVIKSISPGFFIGVPRFYEKLWRGIEDNIRKKPWALRTFIHLAIGIGGLYARQVREKKKINWFLKITHRMMDRLVLAKIRGIMGSELKYMLCGSAPIAVHLLEFYHAIGFVILEAYGLSENVIPMSTNTHDSFKFGTVGNILPENEIRFDPESVILVRGPGVFSGYHRDDKTTPFNEEGFYDTGDFGELKGNFLTLKGRRAELIKTSTGRRISPVHVESALKTFSIIDQAVVFGSGHKRLIALLTLNPQTASTQYLSGHWQEPSPKFLADLKAGLMTAAEALPPAERPAGYIVLEQTFSVITGDLTSSQKLRRKNIQQRYLLWMNRLFSQVELSTDFVPKIIFLSEAQIRQTQFAQMPQQHETVSSRMTRFLRLGRMLIKVAEIRFWDSLPHLDLGEAWFERRRNRALKKIGRIITGELSYLKGPAAKVGQMASYVTHLVPLPIRDSLARLQSTSYPLSNELVTSLVEKSLGRPLDSMFSHWEKMPIAVATMSQVHLARLITGESVVVKVLHPDTRKVTHGDLETLRIIFPLLGKGIGISNSLEIMQELFDLFIQECDLRREAVHQEIFHRLYANDPHVIIPKIYWQCTSNDVLTMEYVSGVSYQQFKAAAGQKAKNRVGEIILETISTAICRYGIFNADPHPGNYLFLDNKVCFLDFGFIRRWPKPFIDTWKLQSLAGARGDIDEFIKMSTTLGFKGVNDFQALLNQFTAISYAPWKEDRMYRFTSSFLNSELKKLFYYGNKIGTFRMPPEFVAISRLFAGQYALLSDLGAESNWHRILMPLLNGPTLSLIEVEKDIIP